MARLIRSHDWSATALGAIEGWPQSLETVVDLVVDSPTAMMVLWGPHLIQIYNDAYRTVLGDRHPRALGRSAIEAGSETASLVGETYAEARRGIPRSLERRRLIIERQGRRDAAWFDVHLSPLRDHGEGVAGVLITLIDATERTRAEDGRLHAEQALRDSEEQYRTLFTSMTEAFCIIERIGGADGEPVDFVYRAANPAFAAQSGLGEVTGTTIRQVVPSEADGWIRIYDEVLRTGKAMRFERTLKSRQRTLELHAFRLDDRTGRRVGVVFSDITKLKREQESLQASEERLELALSAGHSGAWDWDLVRDVSTVSPSYRDLVGLPPDTPVTYDVWLSTIHPDDRERAQAYGEEILRSGTEWRLDFRILHPERGERWIEAVGRVHRDADGRAVRFVGVQSDVTERKRTEEALREADRAKDEFLAVLGHELRNPLAPLSMSLELLARARARPELIDSIRPMMKRQLDHLTRLVDDLLDISRLTRGHAELQFASLDLRDAVESAVEQCMTMVRERQHELTLDMAPEPIVVHGDFQRLTQVVSNLLANAAKYSDPGGQIGLRCARSGSQAVVELTDTGYGIPQERLGMLFQMFSQVPEHRQLVGGGGLGIGLALSRQLIELHGGSIAVESEGLGHGSRFTLRLPVTAASRDAAQASDQPSGVTAHQRRILVVDDNLDAAEGTCLLLKLQGHEAQAVHDGEAALQAVKRLQPEIVLLDLGLPQMDGFEISRRIRAMPGGQGMKIVALTGWGQPADKRRTRAAGFDEHLTKPIDEARLFRVIGG